MAGTVEAEGLSEFNMALGRATRKIPATAQRIATLAATMVVTDAVPTVPRRSGKAARSIQGYATANGAEVMGGRGILYFRWLAVGGRSGRKLSNVRRIVKPDRYINPAYERNRERIARMANAELTKAFRNEGLEVT